MSKKIMVQVPSYVYIEASPALLQQLVNAPMYEYDWDKKCYFLADSDRIEIRTATADQIMTVSKAEFKAVEEVSDNG